PLPGVHAADRPVARRPRLLRVVGALSASARGRREAPAGRDLDLARALGPLPPGDARAARSLDAGLLPGLPEPASAGAADPARLRGRPPDGVRRDRLARGRPHP